MISPQEVERELKSGITQDVEAYGNGATNGRHLRPSEPLVVTMDTIEEERVDYLWLDRIPLAKLTMIDGDPGAGKSFFCLAVGAHVSNGKPLPGDRRKATPSQVLLMSVEDGFADTVKPRLRALGADMSRIRHS